MNIDGKACNGTILNKREANKIAKLYIKALFIYYDGFYCDSLSELENDLVQQQIRLIVDKICPIEEVPTSIDGIVSLVLDYEENE